MFRHGKITDPQKRLASVAETMRQLSTFTDPAAMSDYYGERVGDFIQMDGFLAASRRGHEYPEYRITRSDMWTEQIDPWREKSRLPLLQGGILAELLYGNEPRIIDPFQVDPGDPARKYLEGFKLLAAVPHYDRGESLNMVFHLFKDGSLFDINEFPEIVWMSGLFGRGVNNLVLSRELKVAFDSLDAELKVVSEIQRSLLPAVLPEIPTLKLASYYQTSSRAGGDYYDFFPLDDGKWGIFIADVSGHGTPAAVVMTALHALAHSHPGPHEPPGSLLSYLNKKRFSIARVESAPSFITAFYGIYDPANRTLEYAGAGHPPPRVLKAGTFDVAPLAGARSFPLGIDPDQEFDVAVYQFKPGDLFLMYTDGIIEAFSPEGDMFGIERLDQAILQSPNDPRTMINYVRAAVDMFTAPRRAEDDRTILAGVVT